MSGIENRYRSALRWYPASWRDVNQDVVLSTLLDVADAEGRDRPTARERLDLAANGIRTSVERGLPRSVRDRASALALGIGAAFAAVYLYFFELDGSGGGSLGGEKAELVFGPDRDFGWGPFASAAAVVMLAWIFAFVAGILGGRRIMMVALAASVAAGVVVVAGGEADWAVLRPAATTLFVLAGLAAVAVIGDPGRTPRTVGWSGLSAAVSLVAIVALVRPTFWSSLPPGRYFFELVLHPFWVGATLGSLLVVAAVMRRGDWCLAVLLVALPWLLLIGWEIYLGVGGAFAPLYGVLALIGLVAFTVTVSVTMMRRVGAADARIRGS